MCHLHRLNFFSLIQNHFGYGGILGGPNVAIGYLFNWLMADFFDFFLNFIVC